MKTLYVVPCSATKDPGLVPGFTMAARDAYTGQAFRMLRAQIEAAGLKWCILSGGLGFLWPSTEIETYDALMPDDIDPADWEPFNALTNRQYGRLRTAERIVVLGSSRYAMAASRLLDGRCVEAPFAGLSIGRMLQAIKSGAWK